ncbi:serine/threonine-protein kinase [soil metagenome]
MPAGPRRIADRYTVGDLLGRGGMADVYRARDELLDRDVALKVLRDVSSVDAPRFASEAELLARLDHPAVVKVLDAGVDRAPGDDAEHGQPWLALELVSGSTLDALLRAETDRPDAAALALLGAQVADGLAHAHERGIVHRDVKPSNVLVTTTGVAKLTDFGIARLADASASLTITGHTMGTAAYLSPEQVRAEAVSGATDVYALGLVLLEALTGVRSYPGPAVEAALARLHRAPLVPTSLPAGWPGLITAMTASRADERPSATEVADRLRVLGGVSEAVPVLVTEQIALPVGATPGVAATASRRRGRLLLVAAVVALLMTAGMLAKGLGTDEPAVAGPARTPASPTSSAPGKSPAPSVAVAPVATSPSSAPTVASTTQAAARKRPATKAKKHHAARHPKPPKRHHAKKPKGHGKGKGKGKGHHEGHDRGHGKKKH